VLVRYCPPLLLLLRAQRKRAGNRRQFKIKTTPMVAWSLSYDFVAPQLETAENALKSSGELPAERPHAHVFVSRELSVARKIDVVVVVGSPRLFFTLLL
jgi:hypothetical protein